MDRPPRQVLTRDVLLDGTIQRMVARVSPDLRLLTDAERTASLRATLAARPGGGPVWLFGYGSLIWNPTVHFVERRVARIHGWHRAFCLGVRAGRGTPENPGLVLALDSGGACTGAAFRLEEEGLEAELDLVWRREMLANSYVPRWVALRNAKGRYGNAIAFTMNRESVQYTGKLEQAEVIRRLATAEGELGSAADYLFQTRDGLRALSIHDRSVGRLAAAVEAVRKAQPMVSSPA